MNYIKEYKFTKIINYLRRSRQDIEKELRTGEDTLSEQKKLMDRILSEYGIPYDQKFEIGSGDKIETRPVFQEVLNALEKGIYDSVAVKELSRLGRGSYSDMGRIYDLLVTKRIYIITPYRVYDPSNATDQRQIRFELFLSREEFETTKERLQGGKFNKAVQGKWSKGGSVPFGFSLNTRTQKLEENKEQADVIRLIFNIYVNGLEGREMSFRAISTYLNKLGFNTPRNGTFYPNTIKQILQRKIYIGHVTYNKTMSINNGKNKITRPENEWIEVPNAHDAIVDETLFYEAQKKLSSPNKRVLNKTRLDFETTELSGLIICKLCGNKMHRQATKSNYKKKNGDVSSYTKEILWCGKIGCTYIKYRAVEEAILELINEIPKLNESELLSLLESSLKEDSASFKDQKVIQEHLGQKRKELENRLNFIYEKYESGVYTDIEFTNRRDAINSELSSLDEVHSKRNLDSHSKINMINLESFKFHFGTIHDSYINAKTTLEKNQLLKSIFRSITLEITEKKKGNTPSLFDLEVKLITDF